MCQLNARYQRRDRQRGMDGLRQDQGHPQNRRHTDRLRLQPSGNRASKTVNGLTTWYVRDAQGNVMGVYGSPPEGNGTNLK